MSWNNKEEILASCYLDHSSGFSLMS